MVTAVSQFSGYPIFGKIVLIEQNNILKCQEFESHFNSHYHAYEVHHITNTLTSVTVTSLPYHLAVTRVKSFGKLLFCIRYNIF